MIGIRSIFSIHFVVTIPFPLPFNEFIFYVSKVKYVESALPFFRAIRACGRSLVKTKKLIKIQIHKKQYSIKTFSFVIASERNII